MPDLLQFVDQISFSAVVRLDLNDGAVWELQYDGTDFSPPELRQAWTSSLVADGAHLSAAAFGNRLLRLRLDVHTGSSDDGAVEVQKLHRELNRPANVLRWQPEGMSVPVFFRTFRSMANRVTEWPGGGNLRSLAVEVTAEPFGYGPAEVLPPVTVANDPLEASSRVTGDEFGRTVLSGWGGDWTTSGGSASDFSVTGG